ncbi:DUF4845 domain-containing protein [Aquabacterium fontiphilum]|jgi:Tfp pilus assembly major pilin PilA|uniref:DUF4845 domain-containing protein n=1 Tax=Aquabacterium fontiphilum TaxID=450365 RepID=UPI00137803C6|nr:DUF4845 domain-containing protein [Aquabacterium fontiphilum]NBD21555.1 DUF4845 domain-containing protein [Aquabacterium fontiphilum]
MNVVDRDRMTAQRGVTLVGLLFWAVVVAALALVIMKVVPAVTEYRTVVSMVNKVAVSGGSTVPEIRAAFDREKQIQYGVESIGGQDLEIVKENDRIVVRFAYNREIELIDPVYLLLKFKGQSR